MKDDLNLQSKNFEVILQENKDLWNSISEIEKQSIEKGLQDAETGKLNPHSKAKQLYEKWL